MPCNTGILASCKDRIMSCMAVAITKIKPISHTLDFLYYADLAALHDADLWRMLLAVRMAVDSASSKNGGWQRQAF